MKKWHVFVQSRFRSFFSMFDAIAFVLVKSMQSNAFFYDYAEKQVTGVENFVFACKKKT